MNFIEIDNITFGHRAKNFLFSRQSLLSLGSSIRKVTMSEVALSIFDVMKSSGIVPEDSQIHAFGYRNELDCCYIGISSNSFREIRNGDILPEEIVDFRINKNNSIMGMEVGAVLDEIVLQNIKEDFSKSSSSVKKKK